MINLSAVEVLWISVNVIAATITIGALIEARQDAAALRSFNGSARGIVARATVRRETFRLGSQVALLLVALPAVFSDREISLTPPLIALLSVPVFILANSVSDRRMRNALHNKLEADIIKERDASLAAMEGRMNARADERDTAASDKADARAVVASDEADHRADVASDEADARASQAHDRANEHATAADQRAKVVTKRADDIKVTADETAVEVHDIHAATVEKAT